MFSGGTERMHWEQMSECNLFIVNFEQLIIFWEYCLLKKTFVKPYSHEGILNN